MWITNSPIADVAVVWAKLDGVVKRISGEREFKGFTTPEMKGKLSLRASITGENYSAGCICSREKSAS